MTVKELLECGMYNTSGLPVEIRRTIVPKGEKASFIVTEDEAIRDFGDYTVWIAFRDPGTYENPVDGGPVYAVAIDRDGTEWKRKHEVKSNVEKAKTFCFAGTEERCD